MESSSTSVRKFLYSHYFYGGVRQALGVLIPPFILISLFHQPVIGMTAAFGALCVSIIDQPGPHQHRLNSMLGCVALGTLTVLITGTASSWPPLLLAAVVAQTFVFGLFSAFGHKGGLVGFACLLLMTLTLHSVVTPEIAAWHALASLCGGLWYTAFSVAVNRLQNLRQEQQALSVALFATAEYVAAKAGFYDVTRDLQSCYRELVPKQSALTEKQQAARDMILRIVPQAGVRADRRRVVLGNVFIDMVDLQEAMLATYTDYEVLRYALPDADFLLFARDALNKLAREIDQVGMAMVENRPLRRSTSIKAELRAMEYEAVVLKKRNFPQDEPEAWIVVVQILRRLRTAARLVARMQNHTQLQGQQTDQAPLMEADPALRRFMSHDQITLKRLTSNLTLRSPHMRYALRLSLTIGTGLLLAWALALGAEHLGVSFGVHSNWIVLTILVIMKPGFALSSQRNRWRLLGTLAGCLMAAGLLQVTQNPLIILAVMLFAAIFSNSLVQLNYMASAVFNTILVLLSFHFLAPGSLMLIGERAIDAVIGSLLVAICSYLLPYWESQSILTLARKAVGANRHFLDVCRNPPQRNDDVRMPEVRDDIDWRLARRDVHAAFSNFAEAFYRMMLEPKSQRIATSYLNDLLVQNHMLASQTSATGPLLNAVGSTNQQPPELKHVFNLFDTDLRAAEHLLETPAAGPSRPEMQGKPVAKEVIDVLPAIARALEPLAAKSQVTSDDPTMQGFETAHLTHQLRQMSRTVQRIREDAYAVQAGPGAVPEFSAKRAEPVIVPQH